MTNDIEHEEVEKLLPWYVTGKLDRAEQSKVESYLRQHPEVGSQLNLICEERESTIQANESLGYPPPDMVRRLMSSLPDARTRPSSFVHILTILTAPTARSMRWAAVVAGFIMIVEAGVILGLVLRGGTQAYREASGPSHTGGFSALVAFADDATAASIERLLDEFNASIIEGPKPGGVYKIRLRASGGPLDAQLRKLAERRDVIRIVLPGGD